MIAGHGFSWRDLTLIAGGFFLAFKGTTEIHTCVEGEPHAALSAAPPAGLMGIVLQIALLDIVFSLDSVITAFSMVSELPVMIAAIIIALGVMLLASAPRRNSWSGTRRSRCWRSPYLLLIGMALLADGFGMHLSKGYLYAAIGFSVAVELLNQLAGRRRPLRVNPSGEGLVRPFPPNARL